MFQLSFTALKLIPTGVMFALGVWKLLLHVANLFLLENLPTHVKQGRHSGTPPSNYLPAAAPSPSRTSHVAREGNKWAQLVLKLLLWEQRLHTWLFEFAVWICRHRTNRIMSCINTVSSDFLRFCTLQGSQTQTLAGTHTSRRYRNRQTNRHRDGIVRDLRVR